MWIVTQAETINAHLPLRADLLLTGYACYFTELIDRFTVEEEQNYELYQLLTRSLERLESPADPFLVVRYFEIRLLEHLGYRPELFSLRGLPGTDSGTESVLFHIYRVV